MAEIYCIAGPEATLIPADHESREVIEGLRPGEGVRLRLSRLRDIVLHRRFFLMVKLGYDAWDPPRLEYGGLPVVKNPVTFRKNATKAAGFYDVHVSLDGSIELEARSIAFANMEEDEFRRLYMGVREVLLERVLTRYRAADVERVVAELLRFGIRGQP